MARVIVVEGAIERKMGRKILEALRGLESTVVAPIVMLINSPGGDVAVARSIVDTMEAIESPVYTLSIGLAASAGALLLCSGQPGKRYATANTEIMIHQPRGTSAIMAPRLEYMNYIKDTLSKHIADRCNRSESEIAAYCETDHYLTAEEALALGLIDEVVQHNYQLEDY